MKKVLIITYYWPPSGGAGVQRWLKFVKYLNEFGWTPVVYTPLNPEMPYRDETLLKDIPASTEIVQRKIVEPYQLYNFFTGKKKDAKFQHGFLKDIGNKASITENASIWIRGNVFIPDARALWIKPSVKFLKTYLKSNPVDLIVSSGPPHSMHLIARSLKKSINIPWIADFRDPWTKIYYFDKLKLSSFAFKKHKKLEQQCLDDADLLITVGSTMKKDFENFTSTPIEVITNGFDHSDFDNIQAEKPKKFTLFYSGMFLPDQNPPELWEVLGELVQEFPDFSKHLELFFIGKTDAVIIQAIENNKLSDFLVLHDYVPHSDLPQWQQKAALLLLSINRIENASAILTGKVFEYLAANRPILAFCPGKSDVAQIINETNSGWTLGFEEKADLKTLIIELFNKYLNGDLSVNQKDTMKYSRKELTRKMAGLFNKVVAEN